MKDSKDLFLIKSIKSSRQAYHEFILNCNLEDSGFSLTEQDKYSSPFALCFAIFGLNLLKDIKTISINKPSWDTLLRKNIDDFKFQRSSLAQDLSKDKPYLQLLTFTLSALYILDTLADDPLENHVIPLIEEDIFEILISKGVFDGKAQSGNFAMFYAIFLEHTRLYLGLDTSYSIKKWIDSHLKNMNIRGFWGNFADMTFLQFQNGYHQYEMLNYFNVNHVLFETAALNVTLMSDQFGHFAPYPGGGGCFDYDAIFMITKYLKKNKSNYDYLILKTLNSILNSQSSDGGFSESKFIRPKSFNNLLLALKHVVNSNNYLSRMESIRYNLTLLRGKHNQIDTHWSNSPRAWSESNLWDSWFRMLTIARISMALKITKDDYWGFINFPGIGYHSE